MKKTIILFLLIVGTSAFSQHINDYKYVVVPSKFPFLRKTDEFRLNTLTKLLLEKYGFVVYLDTDNIPDDIQNYNCNKLYADVKSVGNFINTKMIVELKDCKNNVLFATAEGKSKEKEWAAAYNEALRAAFNSFDGLRYKYNGKVMSMQDGSTKGDIKQPEILPGKDILFAQPIANGYQLVDSAPKVVMKIYNTSSKDNFIAEKGEASGRLYNNNGVWTFEYYSGGKLIAETLNIKF